MALNRAHFRKSHTYWLARVSEMLAPAMRFLRRKAARERPSPPEEWREVALVGADHIGDVLYRSGGLAALKKGLPRARLHFVASSPASELIDGHPALESVIPAVHPAEARSMEERVRLLQARPLDAVICYDSGNYLRDQIAAALAGIPNCAGYVHKGFSGLATHPLSFVFPTPFSGTFARSVEELSGCEVTDLRPWVSLTPEDELVGARHAERCREEEGALLAVGITGNQPQGAPLKERMLETLAALARDMPVSLAFLGAVGDRGEIEERIARHRLRGVVLCGDLRLRECVAFLRRADAAFAVDSGLRHMANAAGIPVVFFRNLYTFKGETGAYLSTETDLAPGVECLSRAELAEAPPLFTVSDGVAALRKALG